MFGHLTSLGKEFLGGGHPSAPGNGSFVILRNSATGMLLAAHKDLWLQKTLMQATMVSKSSDVRTA